MSRRSFKKNFKPTLYEKSGKGYRHYSSGVFKSYGTKEQEIMQEEEENVTGSTWLFTFS